MTEPSTTAAPSKKRKAETYRAARRPAAIRAMRAARKARRVAETAARHAEPAKPRLWSWIRTVPRRDWAPSARRLAA